VLIELDSQREALLIKEEELRLQATAQKIDALQAEIAARKQALADDAEAAKQAVDAAQARAAEARAAADYAAGVAQRTARLAAKGVAAKAEAQKANAEYRRLASEADAQAAEIRRIDGEAKARGNEDRAALERLNFEATALAGDYTASQAAVSRLSLEIERHVVRAPVSGRLADVVSLHQGSHVSEGQRLAVVVPEGEVQVIAEFAPSPALGRVKAGQRAELRLDGFPWAQYGMLGATVRRVDSEVHDNKVRVELGLAPGADGRAVAQHGLPGSVAVEIEQVTPAILLLRAAGIMLSGRSAAP
jgi:membrane fusion protein (multidrug efflux system)